MTETASALSQLSHTGWTTRDLIKALDAFRWADVRNAFQDEAEMSPAPFPADALARVETFVEALEHHGHGRSVVSCQYGHEAHWPGENREYVPLHAGDLRDLVDAVKLLQVRI